MNDNTRSIKGDFIGFTFGGIHSSKLGLVRVSDGSRYNEDLLPPLQDKKAQVAGRDGEIYFGSQYGTKPIKVPVAFDNMNEESFSKLRRILSNKTPQLLWFDESPYKQWLVKSANIQSFKWVCFDEFRNGEKERIYKGEGTIEFSCFSSCATSKINYLDEVFEEEPDDNGNLILKSEYENVNEWKDGSGLKNKAVELPYPNNQPSIQFQFGLYTNNIIIDGYARRGVLLYNAGDIPIKPKIICQIPSREHEQTKDIELNLYSCYNGTDDSKSSDFYEIGKMIISKDIVEKCKQDRKDDGILYFIVDSKLKMIKGATDSGDIKELTGYIYNKYHKSGDYFEIPVSSEDIYFIEIIDKQDSKPAQGTTPASTIDISSIEYTHQYY